MSDSVTPWTVARQAPLSMEFSRQYWNGLPFPPLVDLHNPGIKLISFMSPTLAGRFFTTSTTWEFPWREGSKRGPARPSGSGKTSTAYPGLVGLSGPPLPFHGNHGERVAGEPGDRGEAEWGPAAAGEALPSGSPGTASCR